MEGYNFPGGEIQPQHMNTLYPQQPQFPPGSQQQRDQIFQQTAKSAIQSQAGASLMAPFPPHQPGAGGGPGAGGMGPGMPGGVGGPGMNPGALGPGMGGMHSGMNVGPNMNIGGPGNMNAGGPGMGVGGPGNMPGNMNGPGPGGMSMNGPGMGMPGGQRPGPGAMMRKPAGPMGNMQMGPGMGGMRPGMPQRVMGQGAMNPGLAGQGGMGVPGLGGQGGMPNLGGNQGAMGGLGGPGGGGLSGPGAGNMGNMMSSMGGAAGGMSVGSQPGGMGGPGNMGPGAGGPGAMGGAGMGGMGSMALNGMGGSGAPGMSGGNMGNMPGNRWQYPDGKRTTPQMDDFPPGLASQQHAHGVGGQPVGGLPQHAVGGPAQMPHVGPQIPPGQAPPTQPAASPVGGHPPQHGPGHMPGAPGHMPGNAPRMATPAHPGGPPLMSNAPAPSPHHGSPAHPQHPHQQPHLVGSPAHQNQMSSPRHMTSSSPAPGQGPHRSNAPTPVPPRGASADPMNMRPEGMRPEEMRIEPTMMRMGDGIGGVVRGPDGSLRPANEMMVVRDGRPVRDGMLEGINRAPSADGLGRPVIPPNMRPGEIGRLGPDGTIVRGPYGQPPPYGTQGGNFGQSAPPYVLHQTPAQQHQNMQIQRGAGANVPRSGSLDEMPALTAQMSLPDELGDVMVMPNGPGRPNRQSLPPQMPMMMNGAPRPVPGPGMAAGPRRSIIGPPRPCPLGLGVVRLLQMSHELTGMGGKMIADWQRFRDEYFTRSGKISMTIFYNVEGRKYIVSPELIARFFLTFFESGVNKMSLGLNGAIETSEHSRNELESMVETIQGVWRYELENGWVVEHNGPMKISLVAEPFPDNPQQFKIKIEDLTFTAPTTSYFFRSEKLEGNRIHGRPMTPRVSPGLAARKPGEHGAAGGAGGMFDEQGNQEQEERLIYENVTLPPKPFQAYGFPSAVWRMLALSACVHELQPIMQLDHALQSGPIAALDTYAGMDQTARNQAGFELADDFVGHAFPNFASGFNPSNMSDNSPALAHAHPGMNNPHASTATIGRPTPTPPPVRPGPPGGPRLGMNHEPLAGSGELPPLPKLGPGIPTPMAPGMMLSQSPSMAHTLPPGQQNGQGMKRKLPQPEQGPDVGGPSGPSSGPQSIRGPPMHSPNSRLKPPPAGARKKAKTNTAG